MDEKSPLRYLFFTDRYEAIVWICKNQLSRRNLTDAQKTYLIGRQYEAQKMTVGNHSERGDDGKFLCTQSWDKGRNSRTSAAVAKEHGVGSNTVLRAAKFSKGVDAAEKPS